VAGQRLMPAKRNLEALSDEFVDIEINGHDSNSLMLIDTTSHRDVLLLICILVVVITCTTAAGIFGPPCLQEERTRTKLDTRHRKSVISLTIPGVTPQNEFLSVKLAFEISNPMAEATILPVTFSSVIIFYFQNREVRREFQSFSERITFPPREDTSADIQFFFDRYLSYDHVDLRIDMMESGSITDAVITWTSGEQSHLKFQLWIRTIFGLASMAILAIYTFKLSKVGFDLWTFEQKATLVLNVFSVIGLNPLFFAYSAAPTLLKDMLNTVLYRVFTSYVFVFMLLIIDHILTQKTSPGFFVPKLAWFAGTVLIEIGHAVLSDGCTTLEVEGLGDEYLLGIGYVRSALYGLFVLWFVGLSLLAVEKVDSSERFRLFVYIGVFSLVILLNLSDRLLQKLGNFRLTSGMFTLHFSSLHSSVLLMIFSHWPYEYEIDEKYGVAGEGNDQLGLMDSDESS
jgi:hypothetical protein